MVIITDFLLLLITGLVSLYPINKLVKYRDRKKGRDQIREDDLLKRNQITKDISQKRV